MAYARIAMDGRMSRYEPAWQAVVGDLHQACKFDAPSATAEAWASWQYELTYEKHKY